jgi:hypothetical protein
MHRLILGATVVAAALVAPSAANASDSYYISKAQAERNVRDAAEMEYGEDYGITYEDTSAYCRPQGRAHAKRDYIYHRWVCGWAGPDYDGDTASGRVRIIGHSGDRYSYLILRGITWD